MLFLLFANALAHQLYCPDDSNYQLLDGAKWTGNGWTINGEGRVYGLTAFNLLGGYVEFDMDTSGVHDSVNSNFYTISPSKENFPHYCDIQACNDNSCPFCMEIDIVENNGNCCSATTVHTWYNWNGGCDRGGCQAIMPSSNSRHFKASFDDNGLLTVTIGGQKNAGYNPWPSDQSNNQLKETMNSVGAVLISTMWYGWVPGYDGCPSGGGEGLGSSVMKVSNVKVYGSVMQGGTPKLCSGPSPAPPQPTPSPGGHKLYCPDQSSYTFLRGAKWTGAGWTINAEGRVEGNVAFDMVGGYVEFDMDTSAVHASINTNFYTVSPSPENFPAYCDIQACNDNSCPFCMETDIVENNGDCCSATTVHTWTNWNGGCDRGGCQSIMRVSGQRHYKASWGDLGLLTVNIGGVNNNNYNPYPSDQSDRSVVETMQSVGATLISSQWFGWVPDDGCPSGDISGLSASTFTVGNVRVFGTVKQGKEPPLCTGPSPPTPPPGPTPPPKPSNCADIWKQCGGPGWTGPTCCNGFCTCNTVNQWYSMCDPGSGNSCNGMPESRLTGSANITDRYFDM